MTTPKWTCRNCGHENLGHTETQIGGDGYGDRCAAIMDCPITVHCEICTASHFDGDLVDLARESRWLTKKSKDEIHAARERFQSIYPSGWPYETDWLRGMLNSWREILESAKQNHKDSRTGRTLNRLNNDRRKVAHFAYALELNLRELAQ